MKRLRGDRRTFLLRMMPRGSVCAEIGVWKGDFSALILRVVRPAELHLVDPWRFMSDEAYREARYGGALVRDQREMDRLHEEVCGRFERAIRAGVVHVHRRPSAEAAELFAQGYFDWVYVDGNHLYDFVREDLELFEPKVKDGGLIAGDDYGVPGWWENGVTRAVGDFAAAHGYEVAALAANQFLVRKRRAQSIVK